LYFRLPTATADSSQPVVAANHNSAPAGQLANGVLNLHRELQQGRWYPGDDKGVYRGVYAFAEEGHPPESSGPLIRVPEGTQIHIILRNTLPIATKLYGRHQHPGDPKAAVALAAGETRELQFTAEEPGTYLYWATVVAKDGADLPPSQCKSAVADMPITVGETYDVEYGADHAGTADLQFWLPSFPVLVTQPLTFPAPTMI
jgi:FtsP/CotA-like multicopper oxidase with cupredoxin domain